MSEKKRVVDPIYELDGKISVGKAIPFGLQHILAMFVANIAPILIVTGVIKMPLEQSAALVQSAMIVAGIGTLIQLYPFGVLVVVCQLSWVSALHLFLLLVLLAANMVMAVF